MRTLQEVESKWTAAKKRIEDKPIKAVFKLDTQQFERDIDKLFRKVERSVRPIKISIDTSEAERKLSQLSSRMTGKGGGSGRSLLPTFAEGLAAAASPVIEGIAGLGPAALIAGA